MIFFTIRLCVHELRWRRQTHTITKHWDQQGLKMHCASSPQVHFFLHAFFLFIWLWLTVRPLPPPYTSKLNQEATLTHQNGGSGSSSMRVGGSSSSISSHHYCQCGTMMAKGAWDASRASVFLSLFYCTMYIHLTSLVCFLYLVCQIYAFISDVLIDLSWLVWLKYYLFEFLTYA